jgi:hypothetical protein
VPFCQRNKSSISIVPTFQELFQNPINISIKEEKNQIVEFVWNKETKKRERIQDVVEVVSSNTFASIQQVSEDNLKELLVSILHLCIQMKRSKWEICQNKKWKKENWNKQTTNSPNENCNLIWISVSMRFTLSNNFINNSLYLILTSAIALAERKCRHYT